MTTETKSQQKDIASMDVHELREELKALRESEAYYRSIFDSVPVSLEVGDYSGIKVYLENLRAKGVEDLDAYFRAHPEAVREGIGHMSEDVFLHNKEFLSIYNSNSSTEFLEDTAGVDPMTDNTVYTEDFCRGFRELFVALASGATRYSTQTTETTIDEKPFQAEVTWAIVSGYEDSWARLVVSVIPIDRIRPYI